MKKLYLLALLSVLFFSCSKENDFDTWKPVTSPQVDTETPVYAHTRFTCTISINVRSENSYITIADYDLENFYGKYFKAITPQLYIDDVLVNTFTLKQSYIEGTHTMVYQFDRPCYTPTKKVNVKFSQDTYTLIRELELYNFPENSAYADLKYTLEGYSTFPEPIVNFSSSDYYLVTAKVLPSATFRSTPTLPAHEPVLAETMEDFFLRSSEYIDGLYEDKNPIAFVEDYHVSGSQLQ